MLAASKVKMRGSEKIKPNMNRGNKILGKHIRQFLLPARAAQIRKLDLLILMPFSLPSPFSITRFNFFWLISIINQSFAFDPG